MTDETARPPATPLHPLPVRRSPDDRVLGGVCGGLARYLGLDAPLLRIGAVVLALVTGGAAIFVYLAAWLLLPRAPDREEERTERSRQAAIDRAMTALGDRLRDPVVRDGARRAATSLSSAVGTGVDGLRLRSRRNGAAEADDHREVPS